MRKSCGAWLVVMQMAALAAVLSPAGAGAQTTATITGRVEDQSRGVLPGAAVAALHLESGLTRSTVTDADGRFTLAALPVGGYELRVGPITDPNLPWVLLSRALLHAKLVAERNHARRESLALDARAGAHLADEISGERRRRLEDVFRRLRNERGLDAFGRGDLTEVIVELLDASK